EGRRRDHRARPPRLRTGTQAPGTVGRPVAADRDRVVEVRRGPLMAPRGKFKLNRKTVGAILRGADRGLTEAVHDAAEEMKDKAGPGATVEDYKTDRVVSGIVVGAADQARNGTASKAAQQ